MSEDLDKRETGQVDTFAAASGCVCCASDIVRELRKTVKTLGGDSQIRAILNSFRDTMDDEDTLNDLIVWNQGVTKRKQLLDEI